MKTCTIRASGVLKHGSCSTISSVLCMHYPWPDRRRAYCILLVRLFLRLPRGLHGGLNGFVCFHVSYVWVRHKASTAFSLLSTSGGGMRTVKHQHPPPPAVSPPPTSYRHACRSHCLIPHSRFSITAPPPSAHPPTTPPPLLHIFRIPSPQYCPFTQPIFVLSFFSICFLYDFFVPFLVSGWFQFQWGGTWI